MVGIAFDENDCLFGVYRSHNGLRCRRVLESAIKRRRVTAHECYSLLGIDLDGCESSRPDRGMSGDLYSTFGSIPCTTPVLPWYL